MKKDPIPAHFLLSGALMSLPGGSVLVGYGNEKKSSYDELDLNAPAFYFPDFFLEDPKPWRQYSHHRWLTSDEIAPLLGGSQLDEKCTSTWRRPDEAAFKDVFSQLKDEIASQRLQKAVPYLFSHSDALVTTPLLKRMLSHAFAHIKSYSGYLFGFWNEEQGMLGVSPELLFARQGSTLKTVALAGTEKKLSGSKVSLMSNLKELHEHQLVVEGIMNALQPLGSLSKGLLQTMELPTMYHLMSEIQLELHQKESFESIVRRLHPTPALGAIPTLRGREWLREYQQRCQRGRYGAPAAAVDMTKDVEQCIVAIRQVQWNRAGMHIGAGCGIVEASECEKEWNEILLKMDAIKKMLGF